MLLGFVLIIHSVILKSDKERNNLEIQTLKNRIRNLEYENSILKNYKSLIKSSYKTIIQKQGKYDNDVKEAVKYAMKKAHPDNGGNREEFDKFRELYNKMK